MQDCRSQEGKESFVKWSSSSFSKYLKHQESNDFIQGSLFPGPATCCPPSEPLLIILNSSLPPPQPWNVQLDTVQSLLSRHSPDSLTMEPGFQSRAHLKSDTKTKPHKMWTHGKPPNSPDPQLCHLKMELTGLIPFVGMQWNIRRGLLERGMAQDRQQIIRQGAFDLTGK